MGNSNIKRVILKYQDQKMELKETIESFPNFRDAVKNIFAIPNTVPITLRQGPNYLSSKYNWERLIEPNDLEIEVWNQIEPSISESETLNPFLAHLFKIQNRLEKVVGLGFFISKNICIVPKTLIKLDDFDKFTSNYILKFFDETEATFSRENVSRNLGDHSSNQSFVLFEVHREVQEFQVSYPKSKKNCKFNTIFFNSRYQMLSTQRFSHVEINSKFNFKLSNFDEEKICLPGAIVISDEKEVLGMYQGGIGQLFTPMQVIFDHISDFLQQSLVSEQSHTRDLLFELNNMKISLPWLEDVLRNMSQLQVPSVEVFNPLTQKLNFNLN